jgi:ABC-type transporter Mla subunit MlaD
MAASIRAMEERQAQINAESTAFIEQLRKVVEGAQSKTQEKIEATLETIGSRITAIVANLNETHKTSLESNLAREEAMAGRASTLVAGMTGTVEVAIREITAASTSMAQSVAALSSATTSSIDKLNIGAERLNTAAVGFATAGDRVTAAMGQAATVSNKLTEVSGSLTASASAVEDALRDYRAQREAVVKLLAEVRATIEMARKEAGLTADVLQRLDSSASKLGTAQKAVDSYLDGVSDILAESNAAFRDSVVTTLSQVNYDFHSKLSSAVGLLSSAVSELEVTLGSSAPKR